MGQHACFLWIQQQPFGRNLPSGVIQSGVTLLPWARLPAFSVAVAAATLRPLLPLAKPRQASPKSSCLSVDSPAATLQLLGHLSQRIPLFILTPLPLPLLAMSSSLAALCNSAGLVKVQPDGRRFIRPPVALLFLLAQQPPNSMP